MSRPILFNAVQIAALRGKSVPWACRAAKAGKFGEPVIDPGQKRGRYSLAAIERATGQTFTDEQIERALAAHDYRGPTQAEISAAIRQRILVRTLRAFIVARDDQWKAALAGQKLTKKFIPPAFPTTKGKSP